MTKLARFVLQHRKFIVAFWLVAFLAGGATSQMTTERLSFDFSLPGQAGYETSKKILQTYGTEGLDAPLLLVLAAPEGGKVDDATAAQTYAAVQSQFPKVRIIDKALSGGDPVFSTTDGRAQFAFAYMPRAENWDPKPMEDLEAAFKAQAPSGVKADLTGINKLSMGDSNSEGPGVLAETLMGAVGALAVLLFVFASALALIPLAIAAVSILSTFLILLGITYIADVSFIVQFLVALIGLGVAIDYSLLLVTRWREERDHGRNNTEAVIAAVETAGHAVVFSGLTVAIGLFALVIIPVPFLQSIGYGGMLIPLISVGVTVTLLPVILASIGPRVDWPKIRHENNASKFWTAWATMIVRRRWAAAFVGIAMLVVLVIPSFDMKIGSAQSESLAHSGPAFEALQTLEKGGVPKGILTPMEILSTPDAVPSVVSAVRSVDKVVTVFAETGNVGVRGNSALTLAIPFNETANGTTVKVVKDVKATVKNIPGVEGVVGLGALQLDYLKGVYGNFPLALTLILLITYVLLVRAFRSLLLPLKAVILNLASLAATFGAMTLFWQMGHGSEAIYNIEATGAITFWLPIMVFAFLYGLSMDYEVFILARMREEYDATGDTHEAVTVGLGRTGRLVTSAALILFLAFFALSMGPETDIKLFATGLGFGVLLDATVVRMLLVPALVSLFGSWNWYLPDWAAKLLRVEPSSTHPPLHLPGARSSEDQHRAGAGAAVPEV